MSETADSSVFETAPGAAAAPPGELCASNPISMLQNLLDALPRGAGIINVIDAHPQTLSWLGAMRGHRVRALGVEDFGQSANIDDLYRYHHIDTQAVIDACGAADPYPQHGTGALDEAARYHRGALRCSVEKILAMCADLNDSLPANEQISADALLIKLVARCLTRHPALINAAHSQRDSAHGETVDLELAPGAGEHSHIAVLEDAERLGVAAIARWIRAQRKRSDEQGPADEASVNTRAAFRVLDLRMQAAHAPRLKACAPRRATLTIAADAGSIRPVGARPEAAEPLVILTVCVDSQITDGATCTAFVEDLAAMFAEPRRALL